MQSSALFQEPLPSMDVLRAAADLLLDPNPRVHQVCEQKLLSWGEAAIAPLQALAECDDLAAMRRVRRVLKTLHVRLWTELFRSFVARGELDLEDGLLLLAKLPRALLDTSKVAAKLDAWADDLARILPVVGTKKLAMVLSDYFYWDLGFKGDSRHYYRPENCFFDQVIKQRCGIPISLCSVYILICRRLAVALEGVGLPGHFIVRLKGARSVLLDPFHGGRILTRRDCVERLQVMGYGMKHSYLEGVDDEQMLLRTLGNLLHTFRYSDDGQIIDALKAAQRLLARKVSLGPAQE